MPCCIPRGSVILLLGSLSGVALLCVATQPEVVLCDDVGEESTFAGATTLAGVSGGRIPRPDETVGRSERSPGRAADLNVVVQVNGSSSISVAPGSEVRYEVVGELGDDANEGLAFFIFDLEFDGGDLPQADTPTGAPMNSFVIPGGVTNPAGFGGAVDVPGREGDLVQVGGCQNVIQNTPELAPCPIGSVIPGIAWPGSPEVLVTGTLTAPAPVGTYTLQVTNLSARLIKQDETGVPFWATVTVGMGTVTGLTITVRGTGDCNGNGISDDCDIACGEPGGPCDVAGCGESEDVNGNGTPDECEATTQLTLNTDGVCFGWVEPDSTIAVSVDLTGATALIVGGDFFLRYDKTLLDFVSMEPGDPPFTVEISEIIDEAGGTIDYGVGIEFGDTGTSQDSTMAVVTFTALAEVCDTASLVWFDPLHAPPTKLAEQTGQPIAPGLTDLSAITIDSEDPTIVCPEDVSIATEPGVCYTTDVGLGAATTGDNCGVGAVSDDAPAQFPIGSTSVTWSVVDTCGAAATCMQDVTVTDDELPTITCPDDVSVSADPGACYAISVNLGVSTTDDNCGVDSVSNNAPAQFPVGSTPVTWTVQDTSGNTAQCTQNVTVTDDELPTINGCPENFVVHSDVGGCAAVVTWTEPASEDNCAVDTLASTHNPGVVFSTGTTTVTYTATDIHGNSSTCAFDVTVDGLNSLVVTVELSPVVQTPLTRCITLELWNCPNGEPAATLSAELTFTDIGGSVFRATETVLIPCGLYDCITARDRLHTLRRRDEDFGIPVGEAYYRAYFTDNVVTGGDWLIGGNLNDDFYIDILDYTEFLGQWNTPCPADTTCSTAHPHADINGDGVVSTADFTFIQTNYWQSHEEDCCGQRGFRGADGPVSEIPVRELHRRGLGHLSVADLNGDGLINAVEVAAFIQGERPAPAAKAKRIIDADRAR